MCGIAVHRTGLRGTSFHRFSAPAVFYPIFYPKEYFSGADSTFLLITIVNWPSLSKLDSSLPSWLCEFDSHRLSMAACRGSRRPTSSKTRETSLVRKLPSMHDATITTESQQT